MIRPEVVQYLRENLSSHAVENLHRQLLSEGVTELDFEHCLAEALREPKAVLAAKQKQKKPPMKKSARLALLSGLVLVGGVGLFLVTRKASSSPAASGPAGTSASGESGFVGSAGWVVRLPKDYVGFSEFKDSSKTDEIVHFAKRGADPTSFLNEDLYGQLGIVRLEAAPSQFPANMTGAAALGEAVRGKLTAQGDKFALKTIQIGTLPGVQANVSAPFPRIEAYILGESHVYFFYGGQEDEVWRDIVLSLRDVHSEE